MWNNTIQAFGAICVQLPHLSKHPSDLKQNGTQEKTPFSSTVFHALSHGVIRFVASVSSKNHLLTGWNSLTANQGASIQWFLKLTLATKRSTPCERVWKTVPENGIFSCVPFCFWSLGRFARCVFLGTERPLVAFSFFLPYWSQCQNWNCLFLIISVPFYSGKLIVKLSFACIFFLSR